MIERRAYQRELLVQMVRYAPSPQTSDTVLRAMIKDWSYSGICLIAHEPLEEGQEILVSSVIVPRSKKAVVRWYEQQGNGTYRIGLEVRR